MAQSGVNYFIETYASFDYQNYWKTWFDFKNVVAPYVKNKANTNTLYSGGIYMMSPLPSPMIMFIENDYLKLPSNKYGGVYMTPQTGLWSNNFSHIFLNRKQSLGKTLMFNCLQSGDGIYRGYRMGYTDTNKPFFEYYDNDGMKCLVADFNLPTYHSLSFIKNADSLSIGYYDFLTQENNNKNFYINSDYLIEPTGISSTGVSPFLYNVGYNINNISGDGFPLTQHSSGVIAVDEFLYFTTALYDYDIQIINSGFAADYVQPITGSGILISTGVTGYITGLTSIFSGITGYGITGTGYITDDFGVEYTGYLTGALIANISGTGIIPLTGLVYTPDYYLSDGSVVINTGFLQSCYNSGTSFLRKVNLDDNIQFILETGRVDSIKQRQMGIFDVTKGQFKVFDNSPPSIFVNGILNISGNLMNTGSIYNPMLTLIEDFYNTGYYIESLSEYTEKDSIFTLNIPQKITLNVSGFSCTGDTKVFSGVMNSNSFVFFNGLKINSGEFIVSGNNLVFYDNFYSGVAGKLVVMEFSGDWLSQSGQFTTKIHQNNPYYSQIYLNGQKMIKDIDYLSISDYSLLKGSGIFTTGKSLIYDDTFNTDLFWNNI